MIGLRDARLKKALDSAPDADVRPDAQTRQNILARAHGAVAPAPAKPWWQKLWQSAGHQRAPWNAAFATIVLATLVTVIWYDREVPGARPETVQADGPPPVAAAPAPATPVAPTVAPSQAPVAAAPPIAEARPARKAAQAQPRPNAPATQETARPTGQLRDAPLERRNESAAPRADDNRMLAKGATPQTEKSGFTADFGAASSSRGAAAPPPSAPAPRAAAVAADRQRSIAAIATDLRIEGVAGAVEASLKHPSPLADLLERVIGETRLGEPLDAPVSSRVELRRNGELLGTLELAGAQVRWLPAKGGLAEARVGRPYAPVLQDLKDELGRIARR